LRAGRPQLKGLVRAVSPTSPHPPAVPSGAPDPDSARWFAEEIHPHESRLRLWLRNRFPQLRDLDDVVQEAYLRLMRARERGQIDRCKSYLYSIARNVVLDRYKHEKIVAIDQVAAMEDLPVVAEGRDAAEQASQEDDLILLAEAIRALPDRCRDVLVLRKLEGLSQKEIAERLGISRHTVAAHATAGMKKVMQFLRERRNQAGPRSLP